MEIANLAICGHCQMNVCPFFPPNLLEMLHVTMPKCTLQKVVHRHRWIVLQHAHAVGEVAGQENLQPLKIQTTNGYDVNIRGPKACFDPCTMATFEFSGDSLHRVVGRAPL